jgi:hypothetical protein
MAITLPSVLEVLPHHQQYELHFYAAQVWGRLLTCGGLTIRLVVDHEPGVR